MKKEIARLNAMLGKSASKARNLLVAKLKNQRGHNTKVEEIHASKMDLGTLMEVKPMEER